VQAQGGERHVHVQGRRGEAAVGGTHVCSALAAHHRQPCRAPPVMSSGHSSTTADAAAAAARRRLLSWVGSPLRAVTEQCMLPGSSASIWQGRRPRRGCATGTQPHRHARTHAHAHAQPWGHHDARPSAHGAHAPSSGAKLRPGSQPAVHAHSWTASTLTSCSSWPLSLSASTTYGPPSAPAPPSADSSCGRRRGASGGGGVGGGGGGGGTPRSGGRACRTGVGGRAWPQLHSAARRSPPINSAPA
jgi:hypothetical protein